MDFKVGEKVDVKYLGDDWMRTEIVEISQITQEQADDARKWYPNIQAGDLILVCGKGDSRNFLPGHDEVKRPADTEPYVLPRMRTAPATPAVPFEANVETGADVKPMHPIKLKAPAPGGRFT